MAETIKKVLYNVDQTGDVTSAEQAQARANIGAAAASDIHASSLIVNVASSGHGPIETQVAKASLYSDGRIATDGTDKGYLVPVSAAQTANKLLTLVAGNTYPSWQDVPGLFEAQYGITTYSDIVAAINDKKIVYCRVTPSGTSTRMAFLAYVSNSNAEFQYYRSMNTRSATNQTDEVYVYTVSASGWTTTTRKTNVQIAAGTNLEQAYTGGNTTLTINAPLVRKRDSVFLMQTTYHSDTTETATLAGGHLELRCKATAVPSGVTGQVSGFDFEIRNTTANQTCEVVGHLTDDFVNNQKVVSVSMYNTTGAWIDLTTGTGSSQTEGVGVWMAQAAETNRVAEIVLEVMYGIANTYRHARIVINRNRFLTVHCDYDADN